MKPAITKPIKEDKRVWLPEVNTWKMPVKTESPTKKEVSATAQNLPLKKPLAMKKSKTPAAKKKKAR